MGMIIGRKLPQLKKGYLTVSDKYDVEGAIAAADLVDGMAVVIDSVNANTYKPAAANATDVAGFVLATNVKIDETQWPAGETLTTKAGQVFNLMTKGFIAVEVDPSVVADVKNGVSVVAKDNGTFTTTGTPINGAKYTGVTEVKANGKVLAEVRFHI